MKIIKYQLVTEINHGTTENPVVEAILSDVSMPYTEANYQLALSEAWQGEVTVEEVAETADEIRARRDKLLAATDWTQTLDAPIDTATRDAMRTYRQALRDVPQQDGFPADIQWPELPGTTKAAPDPVDMAFDALRKEKAAEMRRAALLSAQTATDTQALTMPSLYPEWAAGVAYGGEGEPCIVRQPGASQLYRINEGKAHTSQAGWEPASTPSLWTAIQGSEAGTKEDPIPAVRGMEYEYGLYYKDPEDGKTYLCTRTGEAEGGKVILQYLPHELIGQYFEEVPAT